MKKVKNVFLILFLAIAVLCFFNFSDSNNENEDFSERVKIALREVGNQLLLSNKDSISLVLPVKEINVKKFSLSFENELAFKPNILVNIVRNVFEKATFSKNYRVAVTNCLDKEVVYSYEINADKEKTIIPCSGRNLPKKCYIIEVKFLDNNSLFSQGKIIFYILLITLLLWFIKFIYSKNKTVKDKGIKEINSFKIGVFQFYPTQSKLVKKASEIPLSKKECELLEIFVATPNQIIKREELTKKVWEDNGVFVGRSLDTYISKLRKKLKEDNSIQLINIHGVGYKLEIKSQ